MREQTKITPDLFALCDNLKILLAKQNITIQQLAKVTGVPDATISRIALGTTTSPKISALIPLAIYFNVSLDQLVGLQAMPQN